MASLNYLLTPAILLAAWICGWLFAGEMLVPSPLSVFERLCSMLGDSDTIGNISLTVYRSVLSLFITYLIALPAGIICGLSRKIMDGISPLVTLSQSCPPVLWIALLMIWSGMGGVIPVAVAVITMLPVVFFSTASGASSIDKDLFMVTRVYRVSGPEIITGIILPSILPSLSGSLSYALGVVWKVIATAEFFGSPDGIGARLYWSFRLLDTTGLFAWAMVIIIIGFSVDRFLLRTLSIKLVSVSAGKK